MSLERIGDTRRCHHILHADIALQVSVGIAIGVVPRAYGHAGELLLSDTVAVHVALRGQCRHRDGIEGKILLVELVPDEIENVLRIRSLGNAVGPDH